MAYKTLIHILEDFVEAKLSESLHRVTNESWDPADCEAFKSFCAIDYFEAISNAFIESRIYLFSTLDNIEWAY